MTNKRKIKNIATPVKATVYKPTTTVCKTCKEIVYTCCRGRGCADCKYTICSCHLDQYR